MSQGKISAKCLEIFELSKTWGWIILKWNRSVRLKKFVTSCGLSKHKKNFFLIAKMWNQCLPVLGMCIGKHDFFYSIKLIICCVVLYSQIDFEETMSLFFGLLLCNIYVQDAFVYYASCYYYRSRIFNNSYISSFVN